MSNNHPIFKKWFYTFWHRLSSRRFSIRRTFFNIIVLALWFFGFIFPLLKGGKIGWSLGIAGTLCYILYGLLKTYGETNSIGKTYLVKCKISRKVMTASVLDKMLKNPCPAEPTGKREILEDILDIVTDHVRAFRYDRVGEKIFCSLLIEYDNEQLKVICRNRGERSGSPLKKKANMQAWVSMTTMRTIECGNILLDFPNAPANLPYKSVLTIPLVYEDKSIAVLSIDSSEPYHFSGEAERINTSLLPYITLIKTNLIKWDILNHKESI
jgi:hypothetical protein